MQWLHYIISCMHLQCVPGSLFATHAARPRREPGYEASISYYKYKWVRQLVLE